MKSIAHVIKRPVITEKSLQRLGKNQHTFEINLDANKAQVAEAVAKLFNVTVFDVKMIVRKGKEKRMLRKRQTVRTAKRKFAIVTIDPKQSIDLFSEFDVSGENTETSESK